MPPCFPDPVWVSLCLLSGLKMLFVWQSYMYLHFSSWNRKQGMGGIFKGGNLFLSYGSSSAFFSKGDVVCIGWGHPLAKIDCCWEPVLPAHGPPRGAVWEGQWEIGQLILYFPKVSVSFISPKYLLVWLSGRGKEFYHAIALVQCLAGAERLRDTVKWGRPYPPNLGKGGSAPLTWSLSHEMSQGLCCLSEVRCKWGWAEHSLST